MEEFIQSLNGIISRAEAKINTPITGDTYLSSYEYKSEILADTSSKLQGLYNIHCKNNDFNSVNAAKLINDSIVKLMTI